MNLDEAYIEDSGIYNSFVSKPYVISHFNFSKIRVRAYLLLSCNYYSHLTITVYLLAYVYFSFQTHLLNLVTHEIIEESKWTVQRALTYICPRCSSSFSICIFFHSVTNTWSIPCINRVTVKYSTIYSDRPLSQNTSHLTSSEITKDSDVHDTLFNWYSSINLLIFQLHLEILTICFFSK